MKKRDTIKSTRKSCDAIGRMSHEKEADNRAKSKRELLHEYENYLSEDFDLEEISESKEQ